MVRISNYFLITMLVIIAGCNNKTKLTIAIENNSSRQPITFLIYQNDSLIGKSKIYKDTLYSQSTLFTPTVSTNTTTRFRFEVAETGEKTVCSVVGDSLTSNSVLHVNYLEVLFRKGDYAGKDRISADSILEKDFYCEVFYNRNKK